MKGEFGIMAGKKFLSAILAAVTAISILTAAAGADSIEKTAKKTLEIGKSYNLQIPIKSETLDLKIVMPKTGNLTFTYTHYASELGWNLFDTNGATKQSSKINVSAGEANWRDYYYSYNFNRTLSQGVLYTTWNSVSEKASGDVTYKLDKGTYYLRITREKEGASEMKLKVSAKDLDGKTIGASSGGGSKAAKSVSLSVSLKTGETVQLGAVLNPSDSTSSVSWSSDKASVASVSGGKVTAVGKGTAVITAKAGSATAKITVRVT